MQEKKQNAQDIIDGKSLLLSEEQKHKISSLQLQVSHPDLKEIHALGLDKAIYFDRNAFIDHITGKPKVGAQ